MDFPYWLFMKSPLLLYMYRYCHLKADITYSRHSIYIGQTMLCEWCEDRWSKFMRTILVFKDCGNETLVEILR